MKQIIDDRPVTVYDCNLKKVVGVFFTKALVVRYIFGTTGARFNTRVQWSIKRKTRITDSILNIPIALRYSTDEQIELLGSKDYFINDEYPQPRGSFMKGFTSTRKELHDEHCGKYRVWVKKKSNIILPIILFILTSCYSPKLVEWRVTEYKKEGERWIVTAKSARGTEKFITDCKPDSVGSRFLAKPKSIKQ